MNKSKQIKRNVSKHPIKAAARNTKPIVWHKTIVSGIRFRNTKGN